jgi:hypothetical protein
MTITGHLRRTIRAIRLERHKNAVAGAPHTADSAIVFNALTRALASRPLIPVRFR